MPMSLKDLAKKLTPEYASEMVRAKNALPKMNFHGHSIYDEAIDIVVNKRASVTFIQRYLRLGYGAALGIMKDLEEHGIVERTKPDEFGNQTWVVRKR